MSSPRVGCSSSSRRTSRAASRGAGAAGCLRRGTRPWRSGRPLMALGVDALRRPVPRRRPPVDEERAVRPPTARSARLMVSPGDEPFLEPAGREDRHARVAEVPYCAPVRSRPPTAVVPRWGAASPAQPRRSVRWPLPSRPASPSTSPAADRRVTRAPRPGRSTATPSRCEHRCRRTRRRPRSGRSRGRLPNIISTSRSAGTGICLPPTTCPRAMHRDAIAELLDLLQLVRHEDHDQPVGGEAAEDVEQLAALRRRDPRWSARRGSAPGRRARAAGRSPAAAVRRPRARAAASGSNVNP